MSIEAMKLALEALELAQDNLRDHGDNCFLHDEGEYNRCFCGKDSLSNHLQSCVEELDQAIEQAQKQEPVGVVCIEHFRGCKSMENVDFQLMTDLPTGSHLLYTFPPQRQWEGLSVFEINELVEATEYEDYRDLVERTEAKLKEKNNA